ncbi:hypothetical protein G7B40_003500 [Aetokthonos hydrillicola Thurmond2011]|jgi:hypothetical protein|uniref:Uncharacterized protein n=1 Tax=Aetokthonos hydrillicola Thurmond2011 TaxID=2712845 RepID=A0AAP5I1Z2_9CYAN|nr:hypothetical protein [Aetokthonos hydrillicola]MBO3462296.1 hypothetical protein [Aetokthonos hydrillicola CCALA 1050]MBW4590807.1 hypothetical protein [Aetokthonos hydrillicola CCALA 1050]MDR9893648.1 hypothetical protein [Aetokthonos hydrillicola Thurmond2011]
MWQDEILDEIHHFREEHAKSFNYDLDAMFEDWQKKQAEGGREIVNLQQVKQKADEVKAILDSD